MESDDRFLARDQSEAADGFVEGWYLFDRTDHVSFPVHVFFGPPKDPATGEDMDRSWRWQVELAGVTISPDERVAPRSRIASLDWVWPRVQRAPIDEPEKQYRDARIDYARKHDPRDPFGHRTGQIDWLDSKPPF